MHVLRQKKWKAVFLIVAGLTFLNMSFLMAEFSALKGSFSKDTMTNIARMFTLSLSEEEHEHNSGSENSGSLKEFDLLEDNRYHLQSEDSGISSALRLFEHNDYTHPGYPKIDAPPPDGARA